MWTLYRHLFPDGKSYIGITELPVQQRWGLYGSGYTTPKIHQAILRFGWDNIQHFILRTDVQSKKEILLLEKEAIKFYDSIDNGYNSIGHIKTKEERFFLIYHIPIIQIDPATLQPVHRYNSIFEAAEETGFPLINIRDTILKKQNLCKDYYWCKEEEFESWTPPAYSKRKAIICIETQQVFRSIKEAADSIGVLTSNLHKVLSKSAITIRGLHFEYLKDYNQSWKPREPKPKINSRAPDREKGRFIPVYCEETRTTYATALECATALGVTRVAVYHCCNGRSTKIYKRNSDKTKTPYHVRWAN